MMKRLLTSATVALLLLSNATYAQRTVLKNNLLYDATATPNLAVETQLGRRWTADLSVGFNPFTFSNNKKWKHVAVQPELRLWLDSAYHKHFFAAHLLYSHYNVGNIKFPFGLFPEVKDHRLQGDLYALGIGYGYAWRLSRRWSLEAEVGVGLGYTKYDKYECHHCGDKLASTDKLKLMPTKLALNLVYNLNFTNDRPRKEEVPVTAPPYIVPQDTLPVVQPEPAPVPEPVPEPTLAQRLSEQNPVLVPYTDYEAYDPTKPLASRPGALYVYFPVDSHELKGEFRGNQQVMDKIVDLTRQLLADNRSTIRLIQIVGLTSVEGRNSYNQQLSQRRATALKAYVQRETQTPDSLYEVVAGGEGWADFRESLTPRPPLQGEGEQTASGSESRAANLGGDAPSRCQHPQTQAGKANVGGDVSPRRTPAGQTLTAQQRDRVLHIIDTEQDLDRREWLIKQLDGGKVYQVLKQTVLKDQRNSGFLRIYYE